MATQTATHSRRQARRLALGAFVVAWAVGAGLLFLPAWQAVERKAFDVLSVIEPPAPSLPIVIVAIDDASQQQFDMRFPWPRTMHAELIRRLSELGAAVIAFDVQFSEHTTPEEDADMAAAIAEAGNVVLAAEVVARETAETIEEIGVFPIIEFTEAGARPGRTGMVLDGDAIARRVRMHPEAFWRVVVGLLAEIFPDDVQVPYVPPGALLRYLGPPETFPYISYYQVLQGDPSIPEDLFAGAMVLVGLNARTSADVLAGADQFATPFTMLDGRLMPGVEIHATQIENALMGQGILPVHWKWNLLAVSVPLLLALPLLLFWHPVRSTLLVLPVIAALLALAYWLFHERFEWLATTAPLAALFVAYAGTGGGSYLIERRRAGEIRSAFSKYVSGQVVEEMIEHPERLTLGGQRREITVLFSDLAGFTTLSERLAPDAVGKLINVYLNAMTRIIMEHQGTVDKFIGDAVMAEWGAPLEDPQHAEHGVRAALAMQQRMAELQPQFREFGIEALRLRIGLNSGPAIVGNMGSDLLFDYTAMGDTVNLASRLEGVNKLYGTPILISAETAARLEGSIGLRHVDRIRVKGKDKPVDVFTPCNDPALVQASERAFAAYVARDWDTLAGCLGEIRACSPDDPVAAVFEQRAADFAAEPPPPDWDGSVALDKY